MLEKQYTNIFVTEHTFCCCKGACSLYKSEYSFCKSTPFLNRAHTLHILETDGTQYAT